MRATKALIHLDNFRNNILAARSISGGHPKICVPVKANAYGHGAVDISRCALESGAEYLGVATVSEGEELRTAGITAPILLFAQAMPEEIPDIVSLDLIPFVFDLDFIRALAKEAAKANKRLTVHLKVDTGMGRLGCPPNKAALIAAEIAACKALVLGGVATHFAVSDSLAEDDVAYTKEQLRRFQNALTLIREAGIKTGIIHAANSGGLVFHPESHFDMVRPGIFLYGYSPANGTSFASNSALAAKPVMELCSVVSVIKTVKKGDSISYGRTWIAEEDTVIATLPVGYADGFPRRLSNAYSVQIRGKSYPLAGRICMDQCMVNLGSKTEVQLWDKVIIFGPDFVTAEDLARKANSNPHEITCDINKRVPRVYES